MWINRSCNCSIRCFTCRYCTWRHDWCVGVCVGISLPMPRNKCGGRGKGEKRLGVRVWQHNPLVVMCIWPSGASENQQTLSRKCMALCVVPLAYSCKDLRPLLVRNVCSPHLRTVMRSVPASTVRSPLSLCFGADPSPGVLGKCVRGHCLTGLWVKSAHGVSVYTCKHVGQGHVEHRVEPTSIRHGLFPNTGIPTLI